MIVGKLPRRQVNAALLAAATTTLECGNADLGRELTPHRNLPKPTNGGARRRE